MADTKISALTALTGANSASDDVFPIVDTSAVETKKMTRNELARAVGPQIGTLSTSVPTNARYLTVPQTFGVGITTAIAGVVDRLYCIPFFVSSRHTFNSATMLVSTLTAGNWIAGIRNWNPSDLTNIGGTTLVQDFGATGTFDTGATGAKTVSGLACTLEPGWYCMNINGSSAATFTGNGNTAAWNWWGHSISGTTGSGNTYIYRTLAYSGALPADESGQSYTFLGSNSGVPGVFLTIT